MLGSSADFKGITPAANMTSTVGDLAKFAMLQFRDGPAGVETRATLTPVAEHTFRYESDNGFRSRGELAVFKVDDAGRVLRLKLDENYTYPVADWHAPVAGLFGER